MWLSIFFPSLNEISDNKTAFFSASPYGMPIILHQVDASKAEQAGPQTEQFYA
ncbi:hypothetical protein [Vibrio gangliei]|uniref:hypothetical protein n=1 Tax=Vibrio gangliei TaxID=2077090 RepID=UPI0013002D60|nr:hypothetical protein [Vibrio gangliei]